MGYYFLIKVPKSPGEGGQLHNLNLRLLHSHSVQVATKVVVIFYLRLRNEFQPVPAKN